MRGRTKGVLCVGGAASYKYFFMQWKLSNTDTLETNKIVLISEVSTFQGKNVFI